MEHETAAGWLDACVDRELDLKRQLEVEGHLNACPACARKLERRLALQASLRNPELRHAVPAGLESRLEKALSLQSRAEAAPISSPAGTWRAWWGGFATAAALACAALVLAPRIEERFRDDRVAQEVADDHARSLMSGPLTEVAASDRHVVKPWFNGKVDFSPPVKDFADQGFTLEGGRLDRLGGRTVAALVYRRARHPINLFIWPSPGGSRAAEGETTVRGYHLLHWSADGMTYWLISDLNAPELKHLANLLKSGVIL